MTIAIDPPGTTYTDMLARAGGQASAVETYDPNRLVAEVMALLESKGLHPELPQESGRRPMAGVAASRLLRAMGILPAGGSEYLVRHRDEW